VAIANSTDGVSPDEPTILTAPPLDNVLLVSLTTKVLNIPSGLDVPEVPEEPLDPELPEEPLEPEVPDEPLDPELPEVPLAPLYTHEIVYVTVFSVPLPRIHVKEKSK
jgi:hypothetical protein